MKICMRLFDFNQIDIGGQLIIHFHPDDFRTKHRLDVKMRDLLERMNARVRSSCTVQFEVVGLEHFPHCPDQLALHSPRILLHLPAAVPRTFVFDVKLEALRP